MPTLGCAGTKAIMPELTVEASRLGGSEPRVDDPAAHAGRTAPSLTTLRSGFGWREGIAVAQDPAFTARRSACS
jgi:hypothetical protein